MKRWDLVVDMKDENEVRVRRRSEIFLDKNHLRSIALQRQSQIMTNTETESRIHKYSAQYTERREQIM